MVMVHGFVSRTHFVCFGFLFGSSEMRVGKVKVKFTQSGISQENGAGGQGVRFILYQQEECWERPGSALQHGALMCGH